MNKVSIGPELACVPLMLSKIEDNVVAGPAFRTGHRATKLPLSRESRRIRKFGIANLRVRKR
jgi:hypothetical protein